MTRKNPLADLHPDEREHIRERFVAQLLVNDRGCWEWTGYSRPDGYGEVRIESILIRTHRLSWLIYRGEIHDGLSVLHRCDNPPCCNPEHLFLGDALANIRDMIAKGRDNNLAQRARRWEAMRAITHCPYGHPYSGNNLSFLRRTDGGIGRRCNECHRRRERERRVA